MANATAVVQGALAALTDAEKAALITRVRTTGGSWVLRGNVNNQHLLLVLSHVVVNGPIGVQKGLPGGLVFGGTRVIQNGQSIAETFGEVPANCTSYGWKEMARVVALANREEIFDSLGQHDCLTVQLFGDLWPLRDKGLENAGPNVLHALDDRVKAYLVDKRLYTNAQLGI